jgi:deoxyribose-phosphate aldolase
VYHDLSIHDRIYTVDDVRETLFIAMKYGVTSLSVFPFFLQPIKDFVLDGTILACPIDFPYGLQDVNVRDHAILAAIRKGANTIDLVANSNLMIQSKNVKFFDDIEAAKAICVENKVTLRIMLEYRLFEPKKVLKVGHGLKELGIEYIIPATGEGMDEWHDNLQIGMELTNKCDIKVITNGNVWTERQYNSIKESGIFGIRFNKTAILQSVLRPIGV